jgi:hypothetical protein
MLTLEQAVIASGKKPAKGKPFKPTQADIDRCHAAYQFPEVWQTASVYDKKDGIRMIATSGEDDEVRLDYPPDVLMITREDINKYVAKFCEAKHLTT